MMIRELGSENITVNVYLMDNAEFLKCDIPAVPINEAGTCVSFWFNNKLVVYPMDLVQKIEFESTTEG